MLQMNPDEYAFTKVCTELSQVGSYLTLKQIYDVFGWPFVELLLVSIGSPSNPDIIDLLNKIYQELKNK